MFKNGADQVAFDGPGIDHPMDKGPVTTAFKVIEVAQKSKSDSDSKMELYLKKIEAVDLKMEQLESKRHILLDIPVEDLKPSERTILDEYSYKMAQFQQEKQNWQDLINLSVGAPSSIGTFSSQPVLVPNDSASNALYQESSTASPFKKNWIVNPRFSLANRKRWIIGLFFFLLLAVILTVVLLLTLTKPGTVTPPPPKRTTVPSAFTVSTFAGTGVAGLRQGPVAEAQFNGPIALAVDPTTGDVIVADNRNRMIRRISNGIVSAIVGNGTRGFADGPTSTALFGYCEGVTVARNGDIFVSDSTNHRVRLISNGTVRTIAGLGTPGLQNGPGLTAIFAFPMGLAVRNGQVFVSDYESKVIRRIDSDNIVATFAGNPDSAPRDGTGSEAGFLNVGEVTFDNRGNLIVAERYGTSIRRITPEGVVSTISSNFTNPWGVAVDQYDNIYVAERNGSRISGLTPDGFKFQVAGSGAVGNSNGAGSEASFELLGALAIDSKGVLYAADQGSNRIRMITPVWN